MTNIVEVFNLCKRLGLNCQFTSSGFEANLDNPALKIKHATVLSCDSYRFHLYSHPIKIDNDVFLRSSDADVVSLPCNSNLIANIRLDWLETRLIHMLEACDSLQVELSMTDIYNSRETLAKVVSDT